MPSGKRRKSAETVARYKKRQRAVAAKLQGRSLQQRLAQDSGYRAEQRRSRRFDQPDSVGEDEAEQDSNEDDLISASHQGSRTMLTRERSERQAARDANMRLARSRHENIELFMECEEEELSPSQIAAHKQAVTDYQDAIQKIAAVKAAQARSNASTTVVSSSGGTEALSNMPQTQVVVQQPSEPLIGVPRVAFPTGQPQQPQYIIQNSLPVASVQTPPAAGYKLLFDTRTGLILGTVPNESPATNQQPVIGNQNPTVAFVPGQSAEPAAVKTPRIISILEASKSQAAQKQVGQVVAMSKSATSLDQLKRTTPGSSVVSPQGHQIIKIVKTTNAKTLQQTPSSKDGAPKLVTAVALSTPDTIDLTESETVETVQSASAQSSGDRRYQVSEFPSLQVKVVPQRLAPFSVIQSKQAHLDKVLKEILNQSLTGLVRWLFEHGMFQLHQLCVVHKDEEMVLVFNPKNENDSSGGYRWECSSCKYTIPAQHGSFFDSVDHDFYTMLKVIYHWSCSSEVASVLQDTKVDASFLRSVYSLLRSVCSNKVKELIQLGGSEKRPLELAVTKILKPNILTPVYLACIYERLSGLVALQAFEGELRLDLFLEVYVLPHSTISVEGFPQIPPQLRKLQHYNVVASPRGSTDLVLNAMAYIQERVIPMFGKTLSQLRIEIIQSFLNELMWREKYGTNPYNTFNNILLHLKQHYRTGLGLAAPPNEPVPIPIVTALSNAAKIPETTSTQAAMPRIVNTNKEQKKVILLDDYYYGWQEGSLTASQVAGNKMRSQAKFRCHPCKKLFDNNIKLMRHMHAHIESSKQMNLDLSDLTQCKHCFREFETPYSMQCHVEAVHSKDSTPLMCRICDHAFKDDTVLINHMYMMHTAAEMPYVCKVCNYRCSMYRRVIEHFHQEHTGTTYVQCHYCLQVFNIKFSTLQNHGISSPFWMHLYKHQAKSLMRKCPACCLMFFSNFDAKQHRQQDHVSFKSDPKTRTFTVDASKSIYMNMPTKDREAPVRMRAYRGYTVFKTASRLNRSFPKLMIRTEPELLEGLHCLECKSEMEGPEHFLGYVCCSRCSYATCCGKAFANHMIFRHADGPRKDDCSWPVYLPKTMYCVCGFAHQRGNLMAYHLVQCNKKSCYPSTKAARMATVNGSDSESEDDNQVDVAVADSPSQETATVTELPELADEPSEQQDENPNMLNILGLMRRPDQKPSSAPDEPVKTIGEDSNMSNVSHGSGAERGSNDAEELVAEVDLGPDVAQLRGNDIADDQMETDEMEFNKPTLPAVFPSAMVGDQVKPLKNAIVAVRQVGRRKRRRKGTVKEWTHRKGMRTRLKLTTYQSLSAEQDTEAAQDDAEHPADHDSPNTSDAESSSPPGSRALRSVSHSDGEDVENVLESSLDASVNEEPMLITCDNDNGGDEKDTPNSPEEDNVVSPAEAPSPAPDVPSPTPDASSPAPDVPSPTPDASSSSPDAPSPAPDAPSPAPDVPSPTPDAPSPAPDDLPDIDDQTSPVTVTPYESKPDSPAGSASADDEPMVVDTDKDGVAKSTSETLPDVLTEEKPIDNEDEVNDPAEDDDEEMPPVLDCYADSDAK